MSTTELVFPRPGPRAAPWASTWAWLDPAAAESLDLWEQSTKPQTCSCVPAGKGSCASHVCVLWGRVTMIDRCQGGVWHELRCNISQFSEKDQSGVFFISSIKTKQMMSLKIRLVESNCSSLSILHLYCVLIKTHMGKSLFFSWTEALFNLGMGIWQKCCIRIFRLIKMKYSNICLFKWDLMRKNLFRITKILARFMNKLMIRRYSKMFYNNVAIYCKVLFWLKTCANNNKTYI